MCEYYNRKCFIISECCSKKYCCRLCHDINEYDNQDNIDLAHKINRFNIKKVVCKECNTEQEKSNKCKKCGIIFGEYYCSICNFYDKNVKDYFHCDKCGICRINKKNAYHCDKCKICVLDKNHNCVVKDINSNCPICLEDLFNSRKNINFLKCGHIFHTDCFANYCKSNYKCPICKKSIYDISNYIEQEVLRTPMSSELQNDVNILCNDCCKKSISKFHIVAVKCKECNSYNTTIIK